jgi:hypothetical protein
VSTVLFGGATPKNGFSVHCGSCSVNDDGPASLTPLAGFMVFNEIYTTPFGYKTDRPRQRHGQRSYRGERPRLVREARIGSGSGASSTECIRPKRLRLLR